MGSRLKRQIETASRADPQPASIFGRLVYPLIGVITVVAVGAALLIRNENTQRRVIRMVRCFVIGFIVQFSTFSFADEAATDSGDQESVSITLEDVVHVTNTVPGFLLAKINSTPLPAGTQCLVRVPLINDSGHSLRVTGGETTCGCTSAELTPDEWGVDQLAMLDIHINTPSSGKTADFDTGILFTAQTSDGPIKLNITFKCALNGMLCFKEKTYPLALTSDDSPQNFEIPFVSSILNPEFELDFDGEIVFERTTIEKRDNGPNLVLTIDPELVPKRGSFGKLTIRDKKSSLEDVVDIIIEHPKKVVISPHTLRFSGMDDADNFTAQAIVRFTSGVEEAQNKACLIEAFIDGKRIKATPKKLSEKVYRIHLQAQAELLIEASLDGRAIDSLSKPRKSVDWRIRFSDENLEPSSPAIVQILARPQN